MDETISPEIERYFLVPQDLVPNLEKRFDSIVRKAGKLGVEPIAWTVLPDAAVVIVRYCGRDRDVYIPPTLPPPVRPDRAEITRDELYPMDLVTVWGAAPRIAGWEFFATLQHTSIQNPDGTDTVVNILRRSPGADETIEIPTVYRDRGPACDHCKMDRRRADTYLVRNVETGQFQQIGSSCLCDFLSGHSPDRAAFYADLWSLIGGAVQEISDEWDGEVGGGFRGSYVDSLDEILELSAACIRIHGWTSAKAARDSFEQKASTADEVSHQLHLLRDRDSKLADRVNPTDADAETAGKAKEWALSLAGTSDYEHNVKVITMRGMVDFRNRALAVSIVASYLRAVGRAAESALKDLAPSKHVGAPGERRKGKSALVLTGLSTFPIETAYGVLSINKFSDADGNVFVWKTGTWACTEGTRYVVTGTIKAHTTFRGEAQTELTRCAVEEQPQSSDEEEVAA